LLRCVRFLRFLIVADASRSAIVVIVIVVVVGSSITTTATVGDGLGTSVLPHSLASLERAPSAP
jgi:hypothetical protein